MTKGVHCKKSYCDATAHKAEKQCVEPAIDKCNSNVADCTWKLCQEGDNLTKGTHCTVDYCKTHKTEKQCIETPLDKCNTDAKDCTWDLCHKGDNLTKEPHCA